MKLSKKLFFFSFIILLVFALPPAIIIPVLLTNKTEELTVYEKRLQSPYYLHES